VALKGIAGIHAMAGDTDGVDGLEEIAGAWLAPDTLARAWALGHRAARQPGQQRRPRLLRGPGRRLVTGPTLTNVNDFRAPSCIDT
jgi:glycerate 2-kinase